MANRYRFCIVAGSISAATNKISDAQRETLQDKANERKQHTEMPSTESCLTSSLTAYPMAGWHIYRVHVAVVAAE